MWFIRKVEDRGYFILLKIKQALIQRRIRGIGVLLPSPNLGRGAGG